MIRLNEMLTREAISFMKTAAGFRLPKSRAVDRDKFLVSLCSDKSVLHLGCTDQPFLEQKLRDGNHLHEQIFSVTKKLWGIDSDEEGIRYLSTNCGFPNLIVGNVENLQEHISAIGEIELVIAGEVLEHVNNPGKVLEGIERILTPGGRLVVSVPNALALRIWYHALARRENVHPDHIAYYSPYTLSSLLRRYGFIVTELYTYWYPSTRPAIQIVKDAVLKGLSLYWPFLGDGVIAVSSKEGDT